MTVESYPDSVGGATPHRKESDMPTDTDVATHLWRAESLGDPRRAELDQGPLEYYERGDGPVLVFAHGWLSNANVWRGVVDRLHERFRCLALDLPLGAHRVAMPDTADLTPDGVAALIAAFLERLELDDVTLVGNDSGGAYSQIAVARHTQRVSGLVLTSCETPYDNWPPAPFEFLPSVARDPEALRQATNGMSNEEVVTSPLGYGLLLPQPFDRQLLDTFRKPAVEDEAVMDNLRIVIGTVSPAAVHSAAHELTRRPDLRVRLAWAKDDPVFPLDHARRYAADLPNAELIEFEGSLSFTPEAYPDAIAEAIAA